MPLADRLFANNKAVYGIDDDRMKKAGNGIGCCDVVEKFGCGLGGYKQRSRLEVDCSKADVMMDVRADKWADLAEL